MKLTSTRSCNAWCKLLNSRSWCNKHQSTSKCQVAKKTKNKTQKEWNWHPIIVCWQVDATSTKEQANAKHQKKPRTKHIRAKANLQSANLIFSSLASQCDEHQGTNEHQTSKETRKKTQKRKSKLAKCTNQTHHHHQMRQNVNENCCKGECHRF